MFREIELMRELVLEFGEAISNRIHNIEDGRALQSSML